MATKEGDTCQPTVCDIRRRKGLPIKLKKKEINERRFWKREADIDFKETSCRLFSQIPIDQYLELSPDSCRNCTHLLIKANIYSPLEQLAKTELQAFKYLDVLYLDKCKIKKIHNTTWIGLEALRTLILERNALSSLPEFLFSPLINLRYLDLSKNHLTYINKEAFKHLQKLTHLILRSCKIAIITKDSFFHLWNLRYLDVQENSISKVKGMSFKKLTRLETLLLSGNKILTIQKSGLQGLKSLKTLSLSNNIIYKFRDNYFTGLTSLLHLDISRNQWSFHKNDSERPFEMLKVLETLDISYQDRHYEDRVPETLFEGLGSLKKLDMKGISVSFLKNVSFSSLTNLTDLDLSETFQESDQHATVQFIRKFFQIRYLILDNNKIKDLPEDTFAGFKFLENLSLKNNKLRNISQNLLSPLTNLRYFDVYMNPLSCSCENYWFQNWSQFNPKVQVPFIQSYSCFGQVARDLNFVDQDLSFCGTDISVFFFIGSFSLTLLFIVTSLMTVKLKWSIHYFYYMARVWCQWNLQKEDKLYKYDAYISYCSDDEEWVMKELLFHLECQGRKKYKICFKARDFIPGVYHIDNIQDAINNSRKTLCIISRNYLESQWCKLEIEMACSKVFYQKEDVLLVVFLENIPDYRLSSYHKLRKLIKQNTYINFPEDPQGHELFWFKLRKALGMGIYEEDALQLSVAH
ncbi:toll-like receptor 13 [Mantella aurantiaca]